MVSQTASGGEAVGMLTIKRFRNLVFQADPGLCRIAKRGLLEFFGRHFSSEFGDMACRKLSQTCAEMVQVIDLHRISMGVIGLGHVDWVGRPIEQAAKFIVAGVGSDGKVRF